LHDGGSATTHGGDYNYYHAGNCEVDSNAYTRHGGKHHHDANLSHLLMGAVVSRCEFVDPTVVGEMLATDF
jgi:hypothetical protein